LEKLIGYKRSELRDVNDWAEKLYPDKKYRDFVWKNITQALKGTKQECTQFTITSKDGSTKLVDYYTSFFENGLVIQMVDITEHKKAENALQASEERYRRLFESAREGMMITGPEGKITRVNSAAAAMLGYSSPQELVGIHAVELYFDPKDRDLMFKNIMDRGFVEHYELVYNKKDGSPIHILGSCLMQKDEEGNVLRTESFFMDITERKTREDEMKRRLMRFRLDDGNLYLVKESFPALSPEAFKDLLNVDYRGLVFSRTPEEEFKKKVDGVFDFRWLAERGGEKSLSTFEEIENSLDKSLKKSVVLLDCLDYLVLKNGFKEALFFVQRLRDYAYLTGNVVVLSVDPSTLSAQEIRLLGKEGREVESRVFVRLPEDLLEILRFIYEHNALGSKPNHSQVRQELGISKPTMGKRIKRLVNTGYVTENPRGRSKILELTYKGMRLFLR